jgi:Trk K+ transport system NAD-binding subunit
MSFPNIPDVDAKISITLEDSVNLLLASVAFEELGLAHIINAEAEKIQYVLGTIEGQTRLEPPPTIEDLLAINRSVNKTLQTVIKKEMLLQFKLEDTLSISTSTTTTSTTTTTTTTTKKD